MVVPCATHHRDGKTTINTKFGGFLHTRLVRIRVPSVLASARKASTALVTDQRKSARDTIDFTHPRAE